MKLKKSVLLALVLGLLLQTSFAQMLPSPQPASQQAGGALPSTAHPITDGSVNVLATQSPKEEVLLPIKGFEWTGNVAYSSKVLLQALNLPIPASGVLSMTYSDLANAVDRVTRFYRTQGYVVARAYLPKQTSASGVIHIKVLEGYHTQRRVTNTSPVTTERLQSVLQEALCQNQTAGCVGALVGDEWNERALRLLNDIPGVAATARLEPGTLLGSSALVIQATPSQLPTGQVSIDNYGSRATGLYRLGISREFNSLNQDGDQLSLSGSASKAHIWSANLGYSVLAGDAGLRVGVNAGHGQYLLGDAFQALGARGESNSIGVFATYPLFRHRERNLTLRGTMDYKVLKDSIDVGNKHFDKRANTYGLQLSGDRVDGLLGGGYSTFSLGTSGGYLRLLDLDSQTNDLQAKTAGGYQKFNFLMTRQQALGGAWTLYGAISGQTANRNVDGSEKMGLGGPAGVRGYAAGEGAGDKGAVANVELRWTKALDDRKTMTLSSFVDRGWVQTNITPWAGITAAPTRSLTGYGLGVLLIKPYDYSMRVLYGSHRAKEPSTIDPAQRYQLWLQASKSF